MKSILLLFFLLSCLLGGNAMANAQSEAATLESPPAPQNPVKFLFIHHSVGGNWLAHEHGGLVNELNKNNYYVNDVTYGWEPSELTDTLPKKAKRFAGKVKRKLFRAKKADSNAQGIGNRTDIGQMPDWFLGSDSELIMTSIYGENLETTSFGDHSNSTSATPLPNPDTNAENQVIMFKSCFPNTMLRGNPDDPPAVSPPTLSFPADSETHTVANAKAIFNNLLPYFASHPNKFFVIATPPPQSTLPKNGAIARGFSNWLVHDWLSENNYELNNVMVFDLFNILTSGHDSNNNDAGEEQGNHHRIWQGKVQHVVQDTNNLLTYPSAKGDDHPSPAGLRKASEEFVPLLNYYYSMWKNHADR